MRPRFFVLCALLLAACSSGAASGVGAGFIAGDGGNDIPPADRQPAPQITATTLQGDELALAELDGPVVLNFWASWCGPCANEAPDLAAVSRAYASDGVTVVGVNQDERIPNALTFERDFDVPYQSWSDPSGVIAAQFGGIGPAALPTTLLLDREHRVAARMFGEVTARQVSARLDALLREG